MSCIFRNRQLINVYKTLKLNNLPSKIINNITTRSLLASYPLKSALVTNVNLEITRHKHKDSKKGKKGEMSESDDEEETDDWDNEIVDKQTKVMNVKVNSLRADVILKAGLGVARNKIETMFYESKIRVNGKKLLKKSAMLSPGDEIDIVRGTSTSNNDFLNVSRVEILSSTERGEGLNVKLRRNKSLTIENYPDDVWKV